ncbi:hypothetical protein ACFVR1_19230 [Psychrobacillus sp. NPDC058041]|uniref:hypothetical protein n=1 Tax=Psychrobacillus sp. NPDC058041 TaxID=3346310 RepID=UPI0036DB9A71
MHPNPVDPEEMAMRQNLDLIASLNMIGEGGPVPIVEDDEPKEVKVSTDSENNKPPVK